MKCPKCGMSLPDDSEFCQYCGSALSTASPPSQSDTSFDYQKAVSAYNRLSTEQKDRFFPGKESQAKKAIGSMVYLLGESSSIDVLFEVYLSIASRLQLGFSNERIQQTIMMRYSSIISPEIATTVINCISTVSKNFGHLQKDRRQEDLSINILFDAQYRQRFAENEKKKDDAITLAGFGVNPENPIYAHGASSSYDYLNKLYSADSIPLIWDRIGSTSTDLSEDLIDAYELCLPDGTRYCTVYINMYSKVTSDYCPKGLYSFELKQIPDGEYTITHNTENCITESADAGKIEKTAVNTITTDTIEASEQPSGPVAISSSNDGAALSDVDQEKTNDSFREDIAVDAIYCNTCGQKLPTDSEFCQYCGSRDLVSSKPSSRGESDEEKAHIALSNNTPTSFSGGMTQTQATETQKPEDSEHIVKQQTPVPDDLIGKRNHVSDSASQIVTPRAKDALKDEEARDEKAEDNFKPYHDSFKQSKNLAFYCKRCGGNVDKSNRKCSQCGKQYFRVGRFIVFVVVGIIIVALSALNGYLYYNSSDRIKRLEQELSEKDGYISDLVQKVSDKDAQISERDSIIADKSKEITNKDSKIRTQSTDITNLQNEVSRLTKRADSFDDICEAARKGNLGYASSNFQASESLIVVKKNQTNRKFTLTANWSSGGTVNVSYSDSYPSAWVDFDNNSWQTSTTMTIDPNFVGVSVVTFSNNVDNKEFSVIIVVTE